MLKTSTILLACACFMLAASVIVAAVALIFHPSKSDAAKILEDLKPQVQCALCKAGIEKEGCEPKCQPRSGKSAPLEDKQQDCQLTETRKEYLSGLIDKKIRSGPSKQAQLNTLRSATKMKEDLVLNRIQLLNLNVPRPSAHWYLTEKSERPNFAKQRMDNTGMRNVSWEWDTGKDVAHSLNGIEHVDGHMNFKVSGWYHVYVQIHFRSNVTTKSSYEAKALIGKSDNKRFVIELKEDVVCSHTHHQHSTRAKRSTGKHPHSQNHSCLVLKGSKMHNFIKGDLLRVEIKMPEEASLDTHISRSYFGAMYLRQPSQSVGQ